MMKKGYPEKGFTLVEMLIVLFVIGVLLLIIVPNLSQTGVEAQQKACEANKRMLTAQSEAYYLKNGRQYPESVSVLQSAKYISEAPSCPANVEEKNTYEINQGTGQVSCPQHG